MRRRIPTTITPHTATNGDVKRALVRSLMTETWELRERYGWILGRPFAVLLNRERSIEVSLRSGAVWRNDVRISGYNHCIGKAARAWRKRHMFAVLTGDPNA